MLTVKINQDECVGCSRCIPACPVDAIVGTVEQSHMVITDECIGCKLCITPCPVDCIEILPLKDMLPDDKSVDKINRAYKAKIRHKNKQIRLMREQQFILPDLSMNKKQTRARMADYIKDTIS